MAASSETSETTQICVRVPHEMNDQIEQLSESGPYEIPKAEVVRTALREHLEGK